MKYIIKGEYGFEGRYAEAEFHIYGWDEEQVGWVDSAQEFETCVTEGTVMTYDEFRKILDYWNGEIESGEIGDWDMGGAEWEVEGTDYKDLVFCLTKEDIN